MVGNRLENLIKGIQKEHSDYFIKASDEDINKFKNLLCKYDLEKVIDFYRLYQPFDIPSVEEGSWLLGIEGIFEESFYGEPGKFLSKFGVFTFATTIGGNLICFDANDVVDGEPSVLYADNNFCGYNEFLDCVDIGVAPVEVVKRKGTGLMLNYENIKDCLFRFEERFSDFIFNLLQNKYGDLEKYVTANRGEYI